MNRLKTGRGDLIGQADKLRKLGANNSKQLSSELNEPQELMDNNQD
jgi:hypothetical protein